jgi:hypothetical protein
MYPLMPAMMAVPIRMERGVGRGRESAMAVGEGRRVCRGRGLVR